MGVFISICLRNGVFSEVRYHILYEKGEKYQEKWIDIKAEPMIFSDIEKIPDDGDVEYGY